jgi:hypothetical protein
MEVNATQDAMLLLADQMYPGWGATIDGKPAHIYRADYLFQAIFVPAGQHTVEFVYRPRSFRLGMLITLLVTVGALAALAFGLPLRARPVTMDSPGLPLPGAAAVRAERGILGQKGPVNDGRQESKGHSQEELPEASHEGREEEVARPSPALAEAAPGDSG